MVKVKKAGKEGHVRGVCAAARCNLPSTVIDGSKVIWKHDTPLCDRHWSDRCDWLEQMREQPA